MIYHIAWYIHVCRSFLLCLLYVADPISLSTSNFLIYNNSIVNHGFDSFFVIQCTWVDAYGPGFLRTDSPALEQYLEDSSNSSLRIFDTMISIEELPTSVTLVIVSLTSPTSLPVELGGNYYCHSGETGDFVTALFVPGMWRFLNASLWTVVHVHISSHGIKSVSLLAVMLATQQKSQQSMKGVHVGVF